MNKLTMWWRRRKLRKLPTTSKTHESAYIDWEILCYRRDQLEIMNFYLKHMEFDDYAY